MPTTDYKAAWRNKRANVDTTTHPAFHTEYDKIVGRNYDAIADNEQIGDDAKEGLGLEFPRQKPNCKSSDVAARYLSALVDRGWGVNVTAIAKAIVGDSLGAALINVYGDTDPVFTNSEMKASLKIYQDWACPFEIIAGDNKEMLKVGQPKRNDAGQTVAGINATGKMELEIP